MVRIVRIKILEWATVLAGMIPVRIFHASMFYTKTVLNCGR
jgi:hypothetical protein